MQLSRLRSTALVLLLAACGDDSGDDGGTTKDDAAVSGTPRDGGADSGSSSGADTGVGNPGDSSVLDTGTKPPVVDSGPASVTDAAVVGDAGGSAAPDAGVVEDAGGSTPVDAGGSTPVVDAGGSTPVVDAGGSTPVVDAGGSTPVVDAGGPTVVDAGAPDAGGSTPVDAGGPPPGESFAALYAGIFMPRCATAACHGNPVHTSGLRMDSINAAHASLLEQVGTGQNSNGPGSPCSRETTNPRVAPGDPSTSWLLVMIAPNPPCGVQMPPTVDKLSTTEQQRISDWIAQGAKNN